MRFDMSPRRVWLGTTVPGKKMVAMISSAEGISRGTELIDLYRGEPHMAFWAAACALRSLPRHGSVGPAFRDLTKPVLPNALFGAMLTDIRDFLKFRFRATGLTGAEAASPDIVGALRTGRLPAEIEPAKPWLVANYAVSALDALSRDREGKPEDVMSSCRQLANLCFATSRSLNPREGLIPHMDKLWNEWKEEDGAEP
jgi:hypothetical protein